MTVLGPNDPRAIVQKRPYFVIFRDREGEERTFTKFTTWPDHLNTMRWLRSQDVEIVEWGIEEPELPAEAEEIISDYFTFEAVTRTEEDV